LGAALAFGRVNEDSEITGLLSFLFVDGPILGGFAELLGVVLAGHGILDLGQFRLQFGLGHDFAQDGGVGALGHAFHTADAILAVEQRDLGRDVGEVAQDAGAGGDKRAERAVIGRQFQFGRAVIVGADDALI